MKCPSEYWIWLSRTLGAGRNTGPFFAHFGDPVTLYEAGHSEWVNSGVFSESDSKNLVAYSPSQSYSVMKSCEQNGWHIITYDDDLYPSRLREIKNPPFVLYVSGDPSVLDSAVSIGIVGTRDASEYGLNVASSISSSLAQAKAVIVSGGALGIDSAAHLGAIEAGGKTIAVLGCGLGSNYLSANESLRIEIANNGAVISEFVPFSEPSKTTFPIRNRIISGITLGTVVVEAGEKSGSLITARLALEQGRDVFAVPGEVTNSNYFGTNNLIRDGAKSVFSYMDILDSYIDTYGAYIKSDRLYTPIKPANLKNKRSLPEIKLGKAEKPLKKVTNNEKTRSEKNLPQSSSYAEESSLSDVFVPDIPEYATDTAKTVLSFITVEGITADELVIKTGVDAGNVLAALTELEIYGCVSMESGKRYCIKR